MKDPSHFANITFNTEVALLLLQLAAAVLEGSVRGVVMPSFTTQVCATAGPRAVLLTRPTRRPGPPPRRVTVFNAVVGRRPRVDHLLLANRPLSVSFSICGSRSLRGGGR